jgi:hypothetical protein
MRGMEERNKVLDLNFWRGDCFWFILLFLFHCCDFLFWFVLYVFYLALLFIIYLLFIYYLFYLFI